VATVRLAVNSRRRTDEGEWVDAPTTFLDGTVCGEQAERTAERLRKGNRVVVTGQLVTRTWTFLLPPLTASLHGRLRRSCGGGEPRHPLRRGQRGPRWVGGNPG